MSCNVMKCVMCDVCEEIYQDMCGSSVVIVMLVFRFWLTRSCCSTYAQVRVRVRVKDLRFGFLNLDLF